MFLRLVTRYEIIQILGNLKNKFSLDCRNINHAYILSIRELLEPVLTILFQKSFDNNIFPSSIKIAKMIPIPKERNKDEISNFRLNHF